MSKEKRLGRGLEALLGKVAAVETIAENKEDSEPRGNTGINLLRAVSPEADPERILQESLKTKPSSSVNIMLIDRNPYQPREDFDPAELDTLSASIAAHGLLQPIVVRSVGERFQIIAGERRFRAATRAGWSEVPVHVLAVDDRQMAELALTENIQRKDLNAIEKANAFARYLEMYGGTHEELAVRLEMERSTVSNLLRLLELPEALQTMVRRGELSQGHARALLPLEEWEKLEVSQKIIAENWSVRQTERFVKELLDSKHRAEGPQGWGIVDCNGNTRPAKPEEAHVSELEQEFRHRLGTKVKLTDNGNGKGKLVIPFGSHEEFERIYKCICRGTKIREAA